MLGVVAWPTTLRPFALDLSLQQVNEALMQVSKCNHGNSWYNTLSLKAFKGPFGCIGRKSVRKCMSKQWFPKFLSMLTISL